MFAMFLKFPPLWNHCNICNLHLQHFIRKFIRKLSLLEKKYCPPAGQLWICRIVPTPKLSHSNIATFKKCGIIACHDFSALILTYPHFSQFASNQHSTLPPIPISLKTLPSVTSITLSVILLAIILDHLLRHLNLFRFLSHKLNKQESKGGWLTSIRSQIPLRSKGNSSPRLTLNSSSTIAGRTLGAIIVWWVATIETPSSFSFAGFSSSSRPF